MDVKTILQKVAAGEMTQEEAETQLNKTKTLKVQFKASPKGCISFYGLRRMPISLYLKELETICAAILTKPYTWNAEFERFLSENENKLVQKEDD